jgi:hypothetical protein
MALASYLRLLVQQRVKETQMARIVQDDTEFTRHLTNQAVCFQHKLAETGLFDDDHLADLIDIARNKGPRFYTLGSLDEAGFGEKWQSGILGDMVGKDVLKAIRKGRLWLQIQGIHEISPKHYRLAKQGFGELQDAQADFSCHKLTCNILISSPGARVLCHVDCAEVILWHVRGRKRVYLYDHETHKLLSDKAVEAVLMRENEEEIAYQKQWDEVAQVYDMEPGQAANWPHFWPHRVDNIEGLNVSMQTEFYSNKGIRNYGVRFANGILRRRAGLNPTSTAITGPLASAKIGLGLVAKKLGLQKQVERKITSRFTIDPSCKGAIRPLSESMQAVLEK